ncbi:hypothetical protein DXG01_004671 [Tephrocybe rancida]|nr:hypothetical protein DXG01_004671 [Tephrocybe rancida]
MSEPTISLFHLYVRTAQEAFNYYESRLWDQLYTYIYNIPNRDIEFKTLMIDELFYIYKHINFVKKRVQGMEAIRLPVLAEMVMNRYRAGINKDKAGNGYTAEMEAFVQDDAYPPSTQVSSYTYNWWSKTLPDPLMLSAGTLMKCLEHHRLVLDPAMGLELSDDEGSGPWATLLGDLAATLDFSDDKSDTISHNPSVGLEFSNDEDVVADMELSKDEAEGAGNGVACNDPPAGMELSDDEDVTASMELSYDEDVAAGMELLDSD